MVGVLGSREARRVLAPVCQPDTSAALSLTASSGGLKPFARSSIMTTQSQGATAPTVFQFQESTQLRVITIDGESWFVAADVCAALSITNEQTRRLDADIPHPYVAFFYFI